MPKDLSAATRAQVVAAVGQGRSVLDVDGSVGADARVLAERECAVTALRTGAPLGAPPEPSLVRSVEVDGALDLAAALGADAAFDVVIIGDELARAADPAELVRAALEHVRPDGTLILSVPNVTHGSVRLALLAGRWEPGRTAARHRFSRATLVRLVQDAGLEVAELRATTADALAGPVDVPDDDLPPSTVQWVRAQPEAAYAHYVLSARRPPSGRPPRTDVPAMVPDAAAEPVHDRYAQAVEAAETRTQELRHRLLTQRDHIIGLEATAARATAELARVRRAGEREIAEMRATTTWRAGRLAVAPVAAVRKTLGGRP